MYENSKYYVENSFAYAPETTMDSEDKTEEAITNLWVSGKFSVMGRAREQTFSCDIFSLPQKTGASVFQQLYLSHKIRANFFMYTNK